MVQGPPERAGGGEGVGVVGAEGGALAGEGVVEQGACCAVLAKLVQADPEGVGGAEGFGVVVAEGGTGADALTWRGGPAVDRACS